MLLNKTMSKTILSGTIHVLTDKENQIYTPMYPTSRKDLIEGLENVDNIHDINKYVDKANKDGQGNNIVSTYFTKDSFNSYHNEFYTNYMSKNKIFRGKEITESWASISNKAKTDNYTDLYIGDYKIITLTTGEQVVMEIAGFDTYRNGIQHIDFISRNCLNTLYAMNTTLTNNGTQANQNPWMASELYSILNNEVYETLPNDLKPYIVGKSALIEERYSSAGTVSTTTGRNWYDYGKLWLPTEVEIIGHTVLGDISVGGCGCCNLQYPIFANCSGRIIKRVNGTRKDWYLMSAFDNNSTQFCAVSSAGTIYGANSNIQMGVPLCFRIA